MSSHHIVRENQEPALLILDPHNIKQDDLGQLLEWSPTVITTQENYEILCCWGIKVDVLLIQNHQACHLEEHMVTILYQDDLYPSMFRYLLEKKNFAINIVDSNFTKKELLPYLPTFTINFITTQFKYTLQNHFEKWLAQGTVLHLPEDSHLINAFSNVNLLASDTLQVCADGFVRMEKVEEFVIIGEAL